MEPGLKLALRILLCTLALITARHISAQANQISFQNVLNDTAPGEIKVIFQDRRGYIWIGGRNSVLRYDAYEHKPIYYLQEKQNETNYVSPYYTTDIFEDKDGEIWLTSHSGLFWFDTEKEIWVRPQTANGSVDAFSSTPLQDIDQLPSGELIIGSDGSGILIFNKSTRETYTIVPDENNPKSLSDNAVQKFLIDSKQRIWVSTNQGLNLFDYGKKEFTLYVPNPDNPMSKVDNALTTLTEGPNGNILGGTLGKGLYSFNPETKVFKHFQHDKNQKNSLAEDSIWDILVDSEGVIWLAYDRSGFSWFDPASEQFKHFTYTKGQPGGLVYNSIRTIFEDRNRDIWVGHYPGELSFHDRSTAAITILRADTKTNVGISDSNVLAVMEDDKENLWLSVGDGVNYLDRKSGEVTQYTLSKGNFSAHGSLSGYQDKKGQIWVGTWTGGYHRYNAQTDHFDAMPVDASKASTLNPTSPILNDATIWTFCETHDGMLWVGTHYAGINRYDDTSKLFTKYKGGEAEGSLSNNIAWACFEDSKQRFWVGTAYGINLMDQEKGTFTKFTQQKDNPNGLQSGSVMDIFEDSKGRLWFGTNEGLHLFRESSQDFEIFGTKDGFNNQGIRSITEDLHGKLWLGTNDGIVQFDPDTHAVQNILVHSGLKIGGINTGAAMTSNKGEIIFGSVEGLIIIDTNKLSTNKIPPPVVLTNFNIYTKPVSVGGSDDILPRVINLVDDVTLDYTKRMFSFEFSALNFRNPSKNHYAYKLEGFDQDWREVGNQRKAQYTNLSAGDYVFTVRASNNDGVWNKQGKSIRVHQLPPPWRTWWAYAIYTLIIVSVIGYFVYSQKRKHQRVEEQNRLLEIKVAERTVDLAAKNKAIQSMLSNMQQGLFTIEMTNTIHPEYSRYLEEIFETTKVAGRNALELLFTGAQLSSDVIAQVEASLSSIIGLDKINYEFNSHLLITEYKSTIAGKSKILSLDWNPILNDDCVEKLMVTVRDITELKTLESQAADKERELKIIGQLLNVDAKKYKNYHESFLKFYTESLDLVTTAEAYEKPLIDTLFRSMHTIKGNSRSIGFTHITNAAHNAESAYTLLKNGETPWNKEQVITDLKVVGSCLEEYHKIYTNVLGRQSSESRDLEGFWLDKNKIDILQSLMSRIKCSEPEVWQKVTTLISSSQSSRLTQILSSDIHSLPSVAEELGKAHPKVVINDNNITVKVDSENLISNVFSHLLRNSIDHGIETPDERTISGKPPQGTISINMQHHGDNVTIKLKDDGKGLDQARLFNRGLELGKWSKEQKPSQSEISELIFETGMSTKEHVSNISGRGVGMDAVKYFVVEAGGNINIATPSPARHYNAGSGEEFVTFEIVIELPASRFEII